MAFVASQRSLGFFRRSGTYLRLSVPQGKVHGAQAFNAAAILAGTAAFVLVRVLLMKR